MCGSPCAGPPNKNKFNSLFLFYFIFYFYFFSFLIRKSYRKLHWKMALHYYRIWFTLEKLPKKKVPKLYLTLTRKIDATVKAFSITTSSVLWHPWPRTSWPFSLLLKVHKLPRRSHHPCQERFEVLQLYILLSCSLCLPQYPNIFFITHGFPSTASCLFLDGSPNFLDTC